MKRSFLKVLFLGAACTYLVGCNTVDQSKLPREANEFISSHFSQIPVTQIVDTITQMGYTAVLENGTVIEFDETGDWEEVNFKKNGVPNSLIGTLPEGIASHLAEYYPEASIKKITKKAYGRNNLIYRLTFNKPNNIELSFTKDGEVISNNPEDQRLPSMAKNLIESQFGAEITAINSDVNGEIEVLLEDKSELEFDRKGNWISVKSKKKALPEGFTKQLPSAMNKYIAEKHPGQFIKKIEKKSYGYQVKLNKPNDIELSFTKSGILISEEAANE